MKYFTDIVEYPHNKAFDILPWGVEWVYVAETFLNGFINYVKPVKAFLLDRYRDDNREYVATLIDPPGSMNWTKIAGDVPTIFARLTVPGAVIHTDLGDLGDDVLILAEIEHDYNGLRYDLNKEALGEDAYPGEITDNTPYMVFWYDRDCSDCCIGRFLTKDGREQVVEEFMRYVKDAQEYHKPGGDLKEIPLHFFKGWVKG